MNPSADPVSNHRLVMLAAFLLIAAIVMMFLSAPQKNGASKPVPGKEIPAVPETNHNPIAPSPVSMADGNVSSEADPLLSLDAPTSELKSGDLKNIKIPITGLEEEIQQKLDDMFIDPADSLIGIESPGLELITPPED